MFDQMNFLSRSFNEYFLTCKSPVTIILASVLQLLVIWKEIQNWADICIHMVVYLQSKPQTFMAALLADDHPVT